MRTQQELLAWTNCMELTQKQKNKLKYIEDGLRNALTEEQKYQIFLKQKEDAQANIEKIRAKLQKQNTEPKTWINCIRQYINNNNIDDELIDKEMDFAISKQKSS